MINFFRRFGGVVIVGGIAGFLLPLVIWKICTGGQS